jgi:hypothetical protein
MSIQNLGEFITEHAMKPGYNHGDRPFPGTLPQPVAEWRCEPQRDVAAISQRYVAASTRQCAVAEGIAQRDFARDCHRT